MAEAIVNEDIKDESVEYIRDVLREEITDIRKKKRNVKLNDKRMILGDTVLSDDYTEEFVRITCKKLRKKPLNIQEYRKLQNALIQSEGHIEAFLKTRNGNYGMIRDLASKSIVPKLAAANCICNISLSSSKECVTYLKNAIPYLLAELESSSEPLAEVCAWTIGNYSCINDKALTILRSQNCIRVLINIAKRCSDTLFPAISYACVRYVYNDGLNMQIKDLVELAQTVSVRYPKVSDIDTMWLIAILSSYQECDSYLMKCLPVICNYFTEAVFKENESIEKLSVALRILCNTVSEESGQTAHCLLDNENEKKNCALINKLLNHQYIHIRQETLWLLGNLLNHRSHSVQQSIKQIIPSLSSLRFIMSSSKKTTGNEKNKYF